MNKDFLGVDYAPICSLASAKFPTLKQALLHALEKLQEEGPEDKTGGICHNILYADHNYLRRLVIHYNDCPFDYNTVMDTLYEIFPKWPHYTGNSKFPVPHPSIGPIDAFMMTDDCWIGKYGKNRLSLLSFCIHFLKENQE